MKIVSVIGARPTFIKHAVLSRRIRASHKEIVIHTGQHYDENLSEIFFQELGIPRPDYNLMVSSGTHGQQTGRMLEKIEKVLETELPDMVIVYGDTNTGLAGALAAAKMNIPVAHVEAGVRSYDMKMPEEINRILIDRISTLMFCPTIAAVGNLRREGITNGVIFTGDVMVDSLIHYKKVADKESQILSELGLEVMGYNVLTVHRPSNADSKTNLENIISACSELDRPVVFPVHPRTGESILKNGIAIPKNVLVVEPLGYLDMIKLIAGSWKIITDSGGIQKEAYILRVPCVTLRDSTEWPETIAAGMNCLAGSNKEKIKEYANAKGGWVATTGNKHFLPGACIRIGCALDSWKRS